MTPKRTISSEHIQTFKEVASGLGQGWIYNSLHSHQHLIKLRNRFQRGMHIAISLSEDRYFIDGGLDRSLYDYSTPVHISTAVKRPPCAIIADIQRKILPRLGTEYAEALSWIDRTAVKTERQQWLHNCLRQLCDIRKTSNKGRHLYILKWAELTTCLVTESNFHNHFDLQLHNLTLDQMIRIAGLIGSTTTGNNND